MGRKKLIQASQLRRDGSVRAAIQAGTVQPNRESPRLQLQLRDMALGSGWHPEGLDIGGEDLGLLSKRDVWERLINEVECGAVVLGMARTCATTMT